MIDRSATATGASARTGSAEEGSALAASAGRRKVPPFLYNAILFTYTLVLGEFYGVSWSAVPVC